jgi:putative serine protease PepD
MRARPVRRFGKLGAPLLAICVLVAAAGCSGSSGKTTAPVAEQTAAVSTGLAALQDAYVNTVNRVRPSVVEVSTSEGLGSGVVYDNDGHIVTNAHVVGNVTRFHVTVLDGRTSTERSSHPSRPTTWP